MSFAACAELVRAGDPDRFAATMTAPPEARGGLFALYAFNLEVARAPWVTSEPMLAQMRVQWWVDAVGEIFEGGTVRRHEVVTPLAEIVRSQGMIRADFDRLLEARMQDIYPDAPRDLDRYIEDTSGALVDLATQALGAKPNVAHGHVGFALGAANLLRALPELTARGHEVFAGLSYEDREALMDGVSSGGVEDAIFGLAKRARARLLFARTMRRTVNAVAAPALLTAWQADAVLKRAEAVPGCVFKGGLAMSEFRRNASLILRATTGRW